MRERKQKNTSVVPDHVNFVDRVTKKERTKENQMTLSATEQAVHTAKTRRYNEGKLELELIRQKWRLQQQQMEAHERRKKIFIKEYEIQRKHRLKQLTGERLFKGPEGTQISSTELRKIKVDIYRNISTESADNELQQDIVNPEDVVVTRRAGEGARPIFKREEITKAASNTEDCEERRTVATVKDATLEDKPQTFKRRSASLSLTRNRSHSRHSRREDYKHDDRENRRSNRGRSREHKEDKRRTQSCHGRDEKRLKERRSHRDTSRSRERDQAKWNRDSHHNKSIRGRSTEGRMPSQQISVIEQIPVPIFYGNFSRRPFMFGPLTPIRGPIVFGDREYPMWPFRPRFPPGIDMYRLRPPRNFRGFGLQY